MHNTPYRSAQNISKTLRCSSTHSITPPDRNVEAGPVIKAVFHPARYTSIANCIGPVRATTPASYPGSSPENWRESLEDFITCLMT